MFNSKYSKVLTVILIVTIVAIIGLLVYLGIDYYKKATTEADSENAVSQFDTFVNNMASNMQNNGGVVEPNINVSNELINVNNTNTNNNNQGGNSGQNSNTLTYKGFKVIGKMEIPKINLSYNILEEGTKEAIEVSIARLYGPKQLNVPGNVVIIGHNYKNGTFFSNNKKLALGDKIYITDLTGKKVRYNITKKYQTNPNDFEYAERDTKGKCEISLSTCTDDVSKRLVIWAEAE